MLLALQALGDQGWREQQLAMGALVVLAGCRSGLGSLHEPSEVPNTPCSRQGSMDVVCDRHGHPQGASPVIPQDTSTEDTRVRLSGSARLRLLHLLGADSKTSKDGKCLQEPLHSATTWEGLPGGPSSASPCSWRSPAPRRMPEIATASDVSALCPGLLWLSLCLSLSPCWELGFPSAAPPSQGQAVPHCHCWDSPGQMCGRKTTKSGVPVVPEPSLQ